MSVTFIYFFIQKLLLNDEEEWLVGGFIIDFDSVKIPERIAVVVEHLLKREIQKNSRTERKRQRD